MPVADRLAGRQKHGVAVAQNVNPLVMKCLANRWRQEKIMIRAPHVRAAVRRDRASRVDCPLTQTVRQGTNLREHVLLLLVEGHCEAVKERLVLGSVPLPP